MRIVVVGARGQLGSAMVRAVSARHECIALDRAALDITDADAVAREMARLAPDVIVNCAGYNAVDLAETHQVDALQANAFAVRSFARAARALGAVLVQFSSDFVFDGTATAPMDEKVAPNPRSAYAASKLLGEWFAADAPRHYVLRVESLFAFGPGGLDKGSLASIAKALRSGDEVTVFGDRTVSPTHVGDAADATLALLERQAEPGTYHLVGTGAATWQEVAEFMARRLGVEPRLRVISLESVTLPARRPKYCALANGKLCAAIGYAVPTWQDAVGRYLSIAD